MPKKCLIKSVAENLKDAFKSGDLTLTKLYQAGSSEKRIELLSKNNINDAKNVNALIEKAMLSANQKLAIRNWIWKNLYEGKPLYKELSLEDSKKMFNAELKVKDLKSMNDKQRIDELAKFVKRNVAEKLNTRFNALKKSGNLANWEERVIGSKELYKDKKLKGAFSKLEVLDDLGVLAPKDISQFMQGFIETKLGVDITMEESQELSTLVKAQTEAFEKVKDDWTFNNEENIIDFLTKQKELQEYTESLIPKSYKNVINKIISYGRSAMLGSPRSLKNSFLYQIIPTVERTIAKRLTSGTFSDADMKSNFIEKMIAKMSGVIPSKESAEFIGKQTAMASRIYNRTGYDISRMQTLDDGYQYFGGEKFDLIAPEVSKKAFKKEVGKIKETKGIKKKTSRVLNDFGNIVSLGPKWFAGGTDMLFANIQRADTALMLSKEISTMEKKKNNLPEGMTRQQREDQLLKDSYSFNPKDETAQRIRELGIMDAHMSNNTQKDGLADTTVAIRNKLKYKDIAFGKVIIPFAKISTATISRGLQTVIPIGVIKNVVKINNAVKQENTNDRQMMMYEGVNGLIGYLGLTGAAVFLAAFLDDDDFVGAYDIISYKEYNLAKAKGAKPGYVRIGGKWIPLKFLPMINIPLSAIMMARQSWSRGDNFMVGYISGIMGGILDAPLVNEGGELFKKITGIGKARDTEKLLDKAGLTGEDIFNWTKNRALPSFLSYDIYNAVVPVDKKFDFMGRGVEGNKLFNPLRNDKSNEVILAFDKLNKEGYLPTISDPTGEYAKELLNKVGEEEYNNILNEFKIDYTDKVIRFIDSSQYKKWVDNGKYENIKDKINKYRTKEILNALKRKNKNTT